MPELGTMPVANAPSGVSAVFARCGFVKQALMVLAPASKLASLTTSELLPSDVVRVSQAAGGPAAAKSPAAEFTETVAAPVAGAPGSHVVCAAGAAPSTSLIACVITITPGFAVVPGTLMRPACPTS